MQSQSEFGQLVAQAELARTDTKTPVIVKIGTPKFVGDGWDWACAFVIQGLDEEIVDHVHGVNSLQALQLAIDAAKRTLAACDIPLTYLEQHNWMAWWDNRGHLDTDLSQ